MGGLPRNSPAAKRRRSEARQERRVALADKLRVWGHRDIFAGLLWLAAAKGYKRGWVSFKFKALFGAWPRPNAPVTAARPMDTDLEEWLAAQAKVKPVTTERVWAKISKLVSGIQLLQADCGLTGPDPADYEAYEVLERIERKLSARRQNATEVDVS